MTGRLSGMSTKSTVESLISQLLSGDVSVVPVLEDAILEGVSDAGRSTYMLCIKKGYKRGSHVEPDKTAEARYAMFTPSHKAEDGSKVPASLRIFGLYYPKGNRVGDCGAYDRTFTVEDTVEYDSFNLSYHGPITSIGPKGHVTVAHERGSRRKTRLDLDRFTVRNWDLDLEEAFRRNSETMQYI